MSLLKNDVVFKLPQNAQNWSYILGGNNFFGMRTLNFYPKNHKMNRLAKPYLLFRALQICRNKIKVTTIHSDDAPSKCKVLDVP